MPAHVVPAYRTNSGGSITFIDLPVGSAAGTSALQGTQATSEIAYEVFPASQTVLMPMVNFPVTMIKNGATAGYGSRLLYTMPRGLVQFTVARVSLTLTTAATGGLVTGAAVVGALGSTAATNADAILSTTEVTYVASTVCTLTAFVGTFSAISALAPLSFVNDAAAGRVVYLNFACPGADIAGDCILVCNGTVTLGYNVV